MKVTEYKIVAGVTEAVLLQRVNGFIENGWQPLGGVGVAVETQRTKFGFVQAMVKYEEEPLVVSGVGEIAKGTVKPFLQGQFESDL